LDENKFEFLGSVWDRHTSFQTEIPQQQPFHISAAAVLVLKRRRKEKKREREKEKTREDDKLWFIRRDREWGRK
jgi:hypothetical protein